MCILKIGCKGSAFWGDDQTKCTKIADLCTEPQVCAIKKWSKGFSIA